MRERGLPILGAGTGTIDCPRKGELAIERCRAYQRETAAAGAACTCTVYRGYAGHEPERSPSEERCGRAAPAFSGTEAARAAAGVEMATKPKDKQPCTRCSNLAPDGEKLYRGLCPRCRIAARRDDPQSRRTVDAIAERVLARRARNAGVDPVTLRRPAAPQKAAHGDRQLVIGAITEGELRELKAELAAAKQLAERQEYDRKKIAAALKLLGGAIGQLQQLLHGGG